MRKEIDFATRIALVAGLGLSSQACSLLPRPLRDNPTTTPRAAETFTPTPTETLVPTAIPTEAPKPFNFFGVDFASEDPISFKFTVPKPNSKNNMQEIAFTTRPIVHVVGDDCSQFIPGTGTSCEDTDPDSKDKDIVHFIHSGIDFAFNPLEGEGLRRYLEGFEPKHMWAPTTITEIQKKMDTLVGQKVAISQGETEVSGSIKAVYRLSPNDVAKMDYMSDLIPELEASNPGATSFDGNGKKEVLLMFCGWLVPGEEAPKDAFLEFFTWSRYIVVIDAD